MELLFCSQAAWSFFPVFHIHSFPVILSHHLSVVTILNHCRQQSTNVCSLIVLYIRNKCLSTTFSNKYSKIYLALLEQMCYDKNNLMNASSFFGDMSRITGTVGGKMILTAERIHRRNNIDAHGHMRIYAALRLRPAQSSWQISSVMRISEKTWRLIQCHMEKSQQNSRKFWIL